MSSWKGNLPKLPIILKYSAFDYLMYSKGKLSLDFLVNPPRTWLEPVLSIVLSLNGSIIPSSGYEIGGSSEGFHEDDFNPIVHSEDCVASDNDEMED
ncbi:hypothetical protein Tco_1474615 [Tanacetum coccineum]